jgi:hypothetical protein
MKYYKFSSSFDTTEFSSGTVNVDVKAKHLMIQMQHLALRCHRQKRSTPTGSTSTGPTIESGLLTGNHTRHHRKGEENYLHKLDQQGKA